LQRHQLDFSFVVDGYDDGIRETASDRRVSNNDRHGVLDFRTARQYRLLAVMRAIPESPLLARPERTKLGSVYRTPDQPTTALPAN
jgi:hypothetical protein